RTGRTGPPARCGEPRPAPAARTGRCRTLPAAGQERTGPLAGGSNDRASQVPGAAHMSGASDPVSVRILDREYTVGVGADGRDALMAAARLLDSKMREIRGTNRM